ncbi:hypothetical protein H6F32_09285 [Anabaena sp. FACHB-1237]|uniref:hypothetical protein n=1 Tax=Anabaena sp. FACHB-1237 TaxID=2692769 RepID=UPI00168090EF|nr:hypothetical protein [Anabaena sp. FACHB-1237]MBD2137778.1 hypothetical protein [Anabaena sp. FACHB-1237]
MDNSNIEINGKPGLIWGNLIVPGSGRLKIKIVRDLLQTRKKGDSHPDSRCQIY